MYTVKAMGTAAGGAAISSQQAAFAVNFFPARPATAPGPATVHVGHVQPGKTLTASVPISVISVFEVVALILLTAEWWIAFRGMRL
jgi:hypothetical protein